MQPQNNHPRGPTRTCVGCGTEFAPFLYAPIGLYCSRRCSARSHPRPRRELPTMTCAICGTAYTPSRQAIPSRPVSPCCSQACRNIDRRKPAIDRFMAHVCKTETCWLWIGSKKKNGYGRFSPGGHGVNILAHRASWEFHFGPIPSGLFVCHHCDTPACVRPDHLFLGTHEENMADMWAKGRAAQQLMKRPTAP